MSGARGGVRRALRFAVDTSVLVALVNRWQERHADCLRLWEKRTKAGWTPVVAAHSAIEFYSVLTRLPAPYRVLPAQALEVLESWVFDGAVLAPSTEDVVAALLRMAPAAGVSGGAVYDALIAECCRAAGASELYTLNARHFAPFAGAGFRVLEP